MTEVTDKMVEAAFYTFCKSRTGDGKSNAESMRDAIEDALASREPVNAGKLVAELREHASDWEREPWADSDVVMSEAASAIEELVEALKTLANEVRTLEAFEAYVRSAMGHPNYNCIKMREEEARAVLTRMGVKL